MQGGLQHAQKMCMYKCVCMHAHAHTHTAKEKEINNGYCEQKLRECFILLLQFEMTPLKKSEKGRGHHGDRCEKQGLQGGFAFISSDTTLDDAWKHGQHTPRTRSPSLLHLQLLPAGVIVLTSQNISESPSVTRIESKRGPGGAPSCVWGTMARTGSLTWPHGTWEDLPGPQQGPCCKDVEAQSLAQGCLADAVNHRRPGAPEPPCPETSTRSPPFCLSGFRCHSISRAEGCHSDRTGGKLVGDGTANRCQEGSDWSHCASLHL